MNGTELPTDEELLELWYDFLDECDLGRRYYN